jgi:peptide/nickel transport system ATP-binding protein
VSALLEVQDLRVEYVRTTGVVPVLNGVNLTIEEGQILGVVGESGAGKSLLLRAILGLLDPPWRVTNGHIMFRGRDLLRESERQLQSIRGRSVASTTPNARQYLNPVVPVGNQIANAILAHQKVGRSEAISQTIKLLMAVGLPDPELRFKAYPHELSGGMCQRIIIAMGLANSPDLLLADEPTSGLDVTISIQILDLMRDLVRDFNSTLLLVSRDLGVIAHYCERVAVMYAGQIVEDADVLDFFDHPTHPYSRHLIRAATAARDSAQVVRPVDSASNRAATGGCSYAPRCPVALQACREEDVSLDELVTAHHVRCLRKHEIATGTVVP